MADYPPKIGKYRILAQIGKGGMGAVFKAEHPTLKRTVIIKKLTLTDSKDFIERFRREAQLMMEFRNDKIVQVYDHFKEGNAYHIVMEFVDGITLEELIKTKRFLSEEAALLIFSEVCIALKYAHDRQIIHRDIKPANILISRAGVVKLVDFGVSASLDRTEEDGLTKVGMTIGTPSYLAPEQIANARNRDRRSDIYSLGVMLYEMVLGRKPFRGGFTPEVIAMIEKGKYLPPKKVNPKIKTSIQRIIRKSMHHKVQKRYQDLGIVAKKVGKLIKKYKTQEDIYQAIRLYLEGKELLEKKKNPLLRLISGRVFSIITSVLCLICLLGVGGFWAYHQGYQYEYLYPEKFGALQVSVKAKKGHKTVEDLYLNAVLYSEKNNSLSKVKEAEFRFKPVKELETRIYHTLESQKFYLKQGTYKLLLYVENEQYRENIYLKPRILQKKKLETLESRKISFSVNRKSPKLPVDAEYSVLDLNSGRNISGKAAASVLLNGKWQDWKDLNAQKGNGKGFVSGNRYRIRFKHPNYYTKFYNLTIKPEQSRVTVKINLTPIPGIIHLKSKIDGIQVFLNGSEYYLEGDLNRTLKKIKPITTQSQKIKLSPGEQLITVKKSSLLGNTITAQKTIRLASKEEIHLSIDEDSRKNQLMLTLE